MLRAEDYGDQFRSAIFQQLTRFMGFAFADDKNLIHMCENLSTILLEISETMQKALDMWKYGLRLSDGALVQAKS